MGFVRRRTRRRTMLLAGGLAYNRGRAAGEAEADYQQPPPAAPPPQAAPASGGADSASELERLASLHQSGALSDEEFAEAKQKVLGS